MTPKCPTFFNKKRWKSGTLWDHLPKRYHFWTIIKRNKKGKKWDTLEWDTLGSWTVIYVFKNISTLYTDTYGLTCVSKLDYFVLKSFITFRFIELSSTLYTAYSRHKQLNTGNPPMSLSVQFSSWFLKLVNIRYIINFSIFFIHKIRVKSML